MVSLTMIRVLRISDSIRGKIPGRTADFTNAIPFGATANGRSSSAEGPGVGAPGVGEVSTPGCGEGGALEGRGCGVVAPPASAVAVVSAAEVAGLVLPFVWGV